MYGLVVNLIVSLSGHLSNIDEICNIKTLFLCVDEGKSRLCFLDKKFQLRTLWVWWCLEEQTSIHVLRSLSKAVAHIGLVHENLSKIRQFLKVYWNPKNSFNLALCKDKKNVNFLWSSSRNKLGSLFCPFNKN